MIENVADLCKGYLTWYCPGCKCSHRVPVEGDKAWTWNGSLKSPTLNPSILCQWDEYDEGGGNKTHKQCHIFVKDGRIQFLGDCTHELAGNTVNMEAEESD